MADYKTHKKDKKEKAYRDQIKMMERMEMDTSKVARAHTLAAHLHEKKKLVGYHGAQINKEAYRHAETHQIQRGREALRDTGMKVVSFSTGDGRHVEFVAKCKSKTDCARAAK